MSASRTSPLALIAQLLGLSAFALAQPVFDLLGRSADFLLAHHATLGDPARLAVLFGVAVPLLCAIPLAVICRLAKGLGPHLAGMLCGALVALTLLGPLVRTSWPDGLVMGFAIVAGVAVAGAYPRISAVRTLLTTSVLALPVFVVLFLRQDLVAAPPSPANTVQGLSETTTDKDIVMLIFDALPLASLLNQDQAIDRDRFPNFARLADQSLWFRRATTVSDRTVDSLPSMLSGRRTNSRQQATLAHHPQNLFTLLGGTHRMVVEEPWTSLCPEEFLIAERPATRERLTAMVRDIWVLYRYSVTPRGLRGGLPSIAQSWRDFATTDAVQNGVVLVRQERVHQFERFLDHIKADDEPTFYFLHTLLPHAPFVHYPSGKRFSANGKEPSGQGEGGYLFRDGDTVATAHSYQRHLLQVQFADRLLGRLLDRLQQADTYDDAVVIVVADHGESFAINDHSRGVTATNFAAIMRVPVFVKLPGQEEGGIVDDDFETMDLLPTVAGLIGMEVPFEVHGQSYLTAPSPRRELTCWGGGNRIRTHRDELQEKFLQVLADKKQLMGPATDELSLFRSEPWGDLVGRSVSELVVGEASAHQLEITPPLTLASVDVDQIWLPGEVAGYVHGAVEGLSLAIALNDVVWTTTRPYASRSRDRAPWSALLPESAIQPGDNHLTVYEIRGVAGAPTLHLVDTGARTRFLHFDLGGRRILGVEEHGFFQPTGDKYRWMGRSAWLTIPVAPDETPKKVIVTLAPPGHPEDVHLFRINDVEVYRGSVPAKGMRREFDLGEIPVDDQITIEFECIQTRALPSESKGKLLQQSLALIGVRVE